MRLVVKTEQKHCRDARRNSMPLSMTWSRTSFWALRVARRLIFGPGFPPALGALRISLSVPARSVRHRHAHLIVVAALSSSAMHGCALGHQLPYRSSSGRTSTSASTAQAISQTRDRRGRIQRRGCGMDRVTLRNISFAARLEIANAGIRGFINHGLAHQPA